MSVVIAKRLLDTAGELPSQNTQLPIRGAEGILLTYANCCRPIPDDHIIAHVSPGKGLVIHREECANIRGYQQESDKYMPVQWSKDIDQEFVTILRVEILNHQGALADLTNHIAATGSNIQGLSTEERDGRLYTVQVKLTTKNRIHLANIMRRIRVINNVIRVNRQRS